MTLGFIGLGDMGLPMARRLLSGGRPVVAWNRSRERMALLEVEGAQRAESPAAVMQAADLVGLCVSSHEAVEQLVTGPNGLFDAPRTRAKVIADFSTGSVDSARRFHDVAAHKGVAWVDAPVTGGVPAAVTGELIIFAGGEPDSLACLQPLLSRLSNRICHMGPSGSGQATKLCNQLIVACNVLAIAEAIAMARRAGADVVRLPEAFKGGFADSLPLQIFGSRMATRVFTPRLGKIALMEKDARLAADLAVTLGARTAMLDRAQELYREAHVSNGLSPEADLSALIGLFERVI